MEESVYQDRLSELPESLIYVIFSFLPIRDVVSTTLLSKRWVNVWTTVPYLNFCEIIREDEGNQRKVEGEGWYQREVKDGEVVDWTINLFSEAKDLSEDEYNDYKKEVEDMRTKTERIRNFLSRVLVLWKGTKILKFKLDIQSVPGRSLVFDVDLWTRFAIKNKVEDLELITSWKYWTPKCLNFYSSLRRLSLVGCSAIMCESPSWNQLKSLRIQTCPYSGYLCGKLIGLILLGSPELEEFDLQLENNNRDDLNISSTRLKKLKIVKWAFVGAKEQHPTTLTICCPNLEKLQLSGWFGKCLFTDISSLVDAGLHFYNGDEAYTDYICHAFDLPLFYELVGGILKHVFSTIQHVEKVELSDMCFQVFGAHHKKYRYLHSPLPNVKFLKLVVCEIELVGMADLLGFFPNLKMLVIEQHADTEPPFFKILKYEENLLKSSLLQLKIVEISVHLDDFSIFRLVECLVNHAMLLEKLVLVYTSCEEQDTFSEKLTSLPISSPKIKVIQKNKYRRRYF